MTNDMRSGVRECQGTYVVLDCNSKEELQRLTIQDQMITSAKGKAYAEDVQHTFRAGRL
jgi:hypothetical protein